MRSLLAISAILIIFLSVGASNSSASNPNRIIMLEPVADEPYDTAAGHVLIYQRNPSATDNNFQAFIEFTIKNLQPQPVDKSYAIYVTSSLGMFRIQTFNTAGSGWQYPSFAALPQPTNPVWLTDKITVEVYIEADDGFDAPDVDGLLVLEGEAEAID